MDNITIAENITKAIDAEIKRLLNLIRNDEMQDVLRVTRRIEELVTTRDTLRGIATWGFDFTEGE